MSGTSTASSAICAVKRTSTNMPGRSAPFGLGRTIRAVAARVRSSTWGSTSCTLPSRVCPDP